MSDINIYDTWKNIKKLYGNNNFQIPGTIWDEEFELTDESYSVSKIQNYFEYIKKHGTVKLINDQPKYMSAKFRTELYSRLKQSTALDFWYLKLWNYLEELKDT